LYLGAFVQYIVDIDGGDAQLTVDSRGERFDVGDTCVAVPNVQKFVWIAEPLTSDERPQSAALIGAVEDPPPTPRTPSRDRSEVGIP
jgi:hypothetical protein